MPDNSTPKHHHNKMGTEPIGKLLLSCLLYTSPQKKRSGPAAKAPDNRPKKRKIKK